MLSFEIDICKVTNALKAFLTGRFSNYNDRNFLYKGFRSIQTCSLLFVVFSTWTTIASEVQRFWWWYFVRPNPSALKISFSWYLANIVGNVVSSQGAVISLTTFSDSPDTSLKVMPCLKKRWKMIWSIWHYFGLNYRLKRGENIIYLSFQPLNHPFDTVKSF